MAFKAWSFKLRSLKAWHGAGKECYGVIPVYFHCLAQKQWCTTNAKQKQHEKNKQTILLNAFYLFSTINRYSKSIYDKKLLHTHCNNLQHIRATENSLLSQTICKSLANTKQKAFFTPLFLLSIFFSASLCCHLWISGFSSHFCIQ